MRASIVRYPRLLALICAGLLSSQVGARTVNGVSVDIDFGGFPDRPALNSWIDRSLGIVRGYYGEFPVRRLTVRVRVAEGRGVKTGTTYGMNGGTIRVVVGREVTHDELRDDWVLVHEMIHLALPDVGQQHAWLSEGLAVYVEGIARAQAGNRAEEDVWSEQMGSMPKGLPQPGDAGLDHTHTWGRTYWGGALLCLMADIEIRRRTQNKFGLQDAMRAVARASGGIGTDWSIVRVLSSGDAATGTHVLESLYREWKDQPVTPDLATLWSDLGVERDGATIRLRNDAPLAATRRAIMRRQ